MRYSSFFGAKRLVLRADLKLSLQRSGSPKRVWTWGPFHGFWNISKISWFLKWCLSSFTSFFGTEQPPSSLHEYCMLETFTAICSTAANEVVDVTVARYGRMRLGRCLQVDYEIGCSSDVLNVVRRRCNGRHSCAILIPDLELYQTQPCRSDLVAYLEVDYLCVPGMMSIFLRNILKKSWNFYVIFSFHHCF